MKAILLVLLTGLCMWNICYSQSGYQPTEENIKNREWFSDAKFGLFITPFPNFTV